MRKIKLKKGNQEKGKALIRFLEWQPVNDCFVL